MVFVSVLRGCNSDDHRKHLKHLPAKHLWPLGVAPSLRFFYQHSFVTCDGGKSLSKHSSGFLAAGHRSFCLMCALRANNKSWMKHACLASPKMHCWNAVLEWRGGEKGFECRFRLIVLWDWGDISNSLRLGLPPSNCLHRAFLAREYPGYFWLESGRVQGTLHVFSMSWHGAWR